MKFPKPKKRYPFKNFFARDFVEGFIEELRSKWWMPDWGFKLSGKRVLKLELHTGGYSDNEELISRLRGTHFWYLYWYKSVRGGHYYFRIGNLQGDKHD